MIASVAVLAVVLRALMLTSEKSLWADEWFSVALAQKSVDYVLWGAIQDVHPPLYFLALHGAIGVFGAAEWVYRLVSFLAGSLTAGVIYFLTKEFFDKKAAFYAFFLAAISPYWLQSSNEIRGYAFLGLLSSLTLMFFIKSLQEPGRRIWSMSYAVSAALAVYVEHYAWFIVLATGVTLFFEKTRHRERKDLWQSLFFILAAGSAALGLVAYQAVFREHMFESYRIREYWSAAILFKKVIGVLWHFTNGYTFSMLTTEKIFNYLHSSPFFWVSAAAAAVGSVLSAISFRALFSKDRALFVLVLTALYFPLFFLLLVYPIRLDARYFSFVAPLFFVMIGGALALIRRPRLRELIFLLLSVTAFFGSVQTISLKTDPVHKEDYRGLIFYVFSEAGPNDVVCGLSPQVRYYQERLGFKPKAATVPELANLEVYDTSGVRRVWVLDQLNMHEEVWQKNYGQIQVLLDRLGFRPAAAPYPFGGEEGLLVFYLFERK